MKVFEQMEASFLAESELEKNKTAEFAARKHFNEVLLQQNANKVKERVLFEIKMIEANK